jgi:ribonuclease VapC
LAVDTSVLIAILQAEFDARAYAEACLAADAVLISAATMHEAHCVVLRRRMPAGVERLEKLSSALDILVIDFTGEQLAEARGAYARFGRGTGHPAALNMGDCFSYALARSRRLPLLFKGDDFVHTDIEPALRRHGIVE